MNHRELVLAALSPAEGALLSPVQVQKLFFLIDQNIGDRIGGPHFDFSPYHYGPFDSNVYRQIEALETKGLAEVVPGPRFRGYRLTPEGQLEGRRILQEQSPEVGDYLMRVASFVRNLSFTDLVSAVYQAYPAMRENSVFQG